MQNKLLTFLKRDHGSVSFEAIWAGLFMAFFFAPTTYLYQYSTTNLESHWQQRWAGRNEAVNNNCLGIVGLPLNVSGSLGVNSVTVLFCPEVEGEPDLAADKRFWKSMDTAADSPFNGFIDNMESEGSLKMVRGHSLVEPTKLFGTELNSSFSVFDLAAFIPQTSELLIPTTEYWQFDETLYQEGHDKFVWQKMPKDATKLYQKVYPSASGDAGGSGTANTGFSNSTYEDSNTSRGRGWD